MTKKTKPHPDTTKPHSSETQKTKTEGAAPASQPPAHQKKPELSSALKFALRKSKPNSSQ